MIKGSYGCPFLLPEGLLVIAMTDQTLYPLFPLATVLYPGGCLPLRIFEPRYVRMTKEALQNGTEFVIVQRDPELADGRFYETGCLAKIDDWNPLPDQTLGIDLIGTKKVKIVDSYQEADSLWMGHCVELADDPDEVFPAQYAILQDALQQLERHPQVQKSGGVTNYQDPSRVSYRLMQLLALPAVEKQALLEQPDATSRLHYLYHLLEELQTP